MTWVKICGITNLEDARVSIDAGAHALGFVFYDKSSRYVCPRLAREIASKLPDDVEKVGVFVDMAEDRAMDIFSQVKLTAMQWHTLSGECSIRQLEAVGSCWLRPKIYYCLPVAGLLEEPEKWKRAIAHFDGLGDGILGGKGEGAPRGGLGRTVFVDSGTAEQPGGTGKPFDWRRAQPLVAAMKKRLRVVVAGGLHASNVSEAIAILKPYGVDVSSGVESRPGKKDREKLRAFLGAVRQAEKMG